MLFLPKGSDSQQAASLRGYQTKGFQRKRAVAAKLEGRPRHASPLIRHLSGWAESPSSPSLPHAALIEHSPGHSTVLPAPSCTATATSPSGARSGPSAPAPSVAVQDALFRAPLAGKMNYILSFFIAHSKTEISRLFVYLEDCIQSACPGELFGSSF